MEKILVVGDIHGSWGYVNTLINKKQPDIILQVGDFGWWPHYNGSKNFDGSRKPWNQFGLKMQDTKLYWCPGNHENWDSLDTISKDREHGDGILEIMDNVFYCEFGSTIKLGDGRVVLFAGGADSIDKFGRIEGNTWWRQETISFKDFGYLPKCKVDIVISHTIPTSFITAFPNVFDFTLDMAKFKDPSCKALDEIFDIYRPSWWFSGHFHRHAKRTFEDCIWESLDMAGSDERWWAKL
jgi:hypothetical protein